MSTSWYGNTASTSSGYYKFTIDEKEIHIPKKAFKEVKDELIKIAEEEEADKQKHLPIFNPEDLDI
jgi:hypothetical protein